MPRSTKFKTLTIPLVGSSNLNRSEPVSIQTTRNFYPEIAGPDGISQAVLHSWPNLIFDFAAAASGYTDRGMYVFNGVLYRVVNDKLYSYTDNPAGLTGSKLIETEIGTITEVTDNPCGFADNGDTMVITNGGTPYSYDGTTLTELTGITFAPDTVQFLNDRFWFDGDDIVELSDSRRFYVSDTQSTTVDVANSAYARSSSDQFYMPIVFSQTVYMYGNKTIEPWTPDSPPLAPPARRVNQGIIEDIGVSSPFGVAVSPEAMFFISNRGIAYRLASYQPQVISYAGITEEFRNYDLTKVVATAITLVGQKFVIFTFRGDDRTWVFSDTSGQWFQLSSGGIGSRPVFDQGRYLGISFAQVYDKTWVGDYDGRIIYSLDSGTLSNSGLTQEYSIKERVLPVITGDTLGLGSDVKLEMSKLRVSMETGGTTLGANSSDPNMNNPTLMVSFSTDGHDFGNEIFVKIGKAGDYKNILVNYRKKFRRLYIKLKISNMGDFHIYSASLDVREAGY